MVIARPKKPSSSSPEFLLRRPSKIQEECVHHCLVEDGEPDRISDAWKARAVLPAGDDGGTSQLENPGHVGLRQTALFATLPKAVMDWFCC